MRIILDCNEKSLEQALICAKAFLRDYAEKKRIGDGCAYGTDYHGNFFVTKTKTGLSVKQQPKEQQP